MTLFDRYIGIDYSGAKTPEASLPGLRMYLASSDNMPYEVSPPPSPRKYWTRRGLAQWLATILRETPRTIVGIDHGFSFPIAYFETYKLEQDWDDFLSDFCAHWPTDAANTYVDFVRDGTCGGGLTGKVAQNGDVLRNYVPHIHTLYSILMYKALWPNQHMQGFLGFDI